MPMGLFLRVLLVRIKRSWSFSCCHLHEIKETTLETHNLRFPARCIIAIDFLIDAFSLVPMRVRNSARSLKLGAGSRDLSVRAWVSVSVSVCVSVWRWVCDRIRPPPSFQMTVTIAKRVSALLCRAMPVPPTRSARSTWDHPNVRFIKSKKRQQNSFELAEGHYRCRGGPIPSVVVLKRSNTSFSLPCHVDRDRFEVMFLLDIVMIFDKRGSSQYWACTYTELPLRETLRGLNVAIVIQSKLNCGKHSNIFRLSLNGLKTQAALVDWIFFLRFSYTVESAYW